MTINGRHPKPWIVDRYAVYEEIASGGMASVHFARLVGHSGFARTVAIKRLHAHLAKDPHFACMLVDEARLAARIAHPNVLTTLDVVTAGNELMLVMDYVHGESVAQLMQGRSGREKVLPRVAAAIAVDMLYGLHAAHEAKDEQGNLLGLVHRDVSPHNLMVGVDGITRVADFGVAKAAGRLQSTRSGAIKGKVAYMAPEQLDGRQVSRQTDVYAATVVIWEMLTGRRLFGGESEAETLGQSLAKEISAPSEWVDELAEPWDAIVLRGLMRLPKERYATAREMAQALERAVEIARASEVGAWVEEQAGARLAERSRVLSAMDAATWTVRSNSVPIFSKQQGDVVDAFGDTHELMRAETASRVHPFALATTGGLSAYPVSSVVDRPSSDGNRVSRSPQSGKPTPRQTLEADTNAGQARYPRRWAMAGGGLMLAVAIVAAGKKFVVGYGVFSAADHKPVVSVAQPHTAAIPDEQPRAVAPDMALEGDRRTADIDPLIGPVQPSIGPVPPKARPPERLRPEVRRGSSQNGPHAAPSAGVSARCNPPYLIDAMGRTIFRKDCF